MRVLLANKFYYRRGGDCIYTINLEELLKAHGHEVAIFAMQHPENLPSVWSKYFPSEVKMSLGMGIVNTMKRPFGTREVSEKFTALLNDFQPDVVHLNNVHTQLSPIIAEIAHERGIKVIWTIHDYKLLCPRYDCLRNDTTVCEDCFENKWNVLRHRCMKNSLIASVIAYQESKMWNRKRLEEYTDVFICPSRFIAEKMAQGGFSRNKLQWLCNFIDVTKCRRDNQERGDYYCYVGRLSHEKGVKTLIQAANELHYRVIVVGGGPLEAELKAKADSNVVLVGYKHWDEIKNIVGGARFSVLPSEWYENNPLSAIESLCLGTPILGARIGGIPELIEEGKNGMTFESGNAEDLKEKLQSMWSTTFNHEQIAQEALKTYDAETYYKRIITIYNK